MPAGQSKGTRTKEEQEAQKLHLKYIGLSEATRASGVGQALLAQIKELKSAKPAVKATTFGAKV